LLRIKTPSRLHMALIDMNGEIGRVDGGIGLTLEEPCIEIAAIKGDEVIVRGDPELADRMQKACEAVCPGKGVEIDILKSFWNHIGLGSGTQAALAAGTAVSRLYGSEVSPREIALKAGRGGTSGIGIGAFERGGFLLDGGHRMSAKKAFLPSSYSRGMPPAPLLFRHDFPDWGIVLAIPPLKGAHDLYEKDIFSKVCPIPLREVEELCHIVLMGMLPSIVEEDLDAFGRAVNAIQEVGFKKRELDLQPVAREVMGIMRDAGAPCAGMSSFGPTAYAVTDAPDKAASAVRRSCPDCTVIVTKARNKGADISWR
jgi:beta-ribofuranosylaminobenzene 5'-phosphate synthase